MLTLLPTRDRGHTKIGWLDSRHTFSFGDHYDPKRMGFRALRVINDDRVAPGQGFGSHPHRDMEIVTYVLDGELAHKDSLGTGSVIRRGDVQRMSAGTGVVHSEFNASAANPVHFLQIWIVPAAKGIPPGYEQKSFARAELDGRLRLVASPDGREGSVTIHADATISAAFVAKGAPLAAAIPEGRHAFVHVVEGEVTIGDRTLATGDGLAVSDERTLTLSSGKGAEVLLFELA